MCTLQKERYVPINSNEQFALMAQGKWNDFLQVALQHPIVAPFRLHRLQVSLAPRFFLFVYLLAEIPSGRCFRHRLKSMKRSLTKK